MAVLVQPSGDMSLMIYKELKEDPKSVESMVDSLKDWLAMQPHLPMLDDFSRLRTFLRGCKYSMEKAKRKLDMYFSMRAAVPELYANRDPMSPELQTVWQEIHIPALSGVTREGNRVTWMCAATQELQITCPAEAMKLALMIGDLRLEMEQTGVAGDVYVLDAAHATPSQFAKFTPSLIKKFLISVQEAYPVRLRQVHIINVNPLVDVIFNLVKPLLKEKIKERIHFHGKDMESLYKFIPQDMIPSEYGGNGGSIKDISASWKKSVESYRQWFLDQEKLVADESRRPGKQRNYDELFGAEGSFRKLSID